MSDPIIIKRANMPNKIRWFLRLKFPSLKAASEHYGVSASMLSAVQCGTKAPPDWLLEDMGIEKQVVTVYVKKTGGE